MAPATKYTCTGLVWSFIFGFGSGVGGMIWLLLKLLRFQRAEIERSYAWLLWQHKHARGVHAKPSDTSSRAPSVDGSSVVSDLDGEWKELLQHVDEYLSEDRLPTMSTREREVAMTAFYEHRHEGKFQYALHEAVKEVIRFRRTESGSFTNICGVVQKAANS